MWWVYQSVGPRVNHALCNSTFKVRDAEIWSAILGIISFSIVFYPPACVKSRIQQPHMFRLCPKLLRWLNDPQSRRKEELLSCIFEPEEK